MLDWLKPILGDGYTEEIDKKISAEIGKAFVVRSDFNEVSAAKKQLEEDVKERDQQLDTLSKANGSMEELQAKISELQEQNKEAKKGFEADLLRIRLDNAVDAALTKAGAKNNAAAKALLADFLTKAKFSDDGKTVDGLEDAIKTLAKDEGTAFLFEPSAQVQNIIGMQPGTPGGSQPPATGKEPKDMTYDELCVYLSANPQAKL